jgi:hypothetical protein
MKKAAIDQARERLDRARDAISRMQSSVKYRPYASAWSDFLLAASGIYSKLQEGAKGCGISDGWFGRKKHERKNDELLRYLHHARNADEHGLGGTELLYRSFRVVSGNVRSIGVGFNAAGDPEFNIDKDPDAVVESDGFSLMLKAVKDTRYGDTFLPPKQHLGEALPPEPKALDVARMAIKYLEGMVDEGSNLPAH